MLTIIIGNSTTVASGTRQSLDSHGFEDHLEMYRQSTFADAADE